MAKVPAIKDNQNEQAMRYIQSHESVAIHARRGDLLGLNYALYATRYFKKAVGFIKKHTNNPIFFHCSQKLKVKLTPEARPVFAGIIVGSNERLRFLYFGVMV